MRKILVIGIGAGDPEHVTVQAISALNSVDVFFVAVKQAETDELVRLRREICERYIEGSDYRWVEIPDPARDRESKAYADAVGEWRKRRATAWARVIRDSLGGSETGAVLAWGDPAVYDSTLAVLSQIEAETELRLDLGVIPGITSPQVLAARHGISLTRLGRPLVITTGRRLASDQPPAEDTVVMLDAHCTFTDAVDGDTEIYWGAYLGTPDEILVAGRVAQVTDEIRDRREEARARKGWIMDTYLLRPATEDPEGRP